MDREFKKLNNVAWEDIDDVLTKVQRSFNIKLDSDSLNGIDSFRKLSDVIIKKLTLEHSDTCTTQHAFYLLRNAIANATATDKCSITPHTKLSELFPRDGRIQAIEEIEQEMGFEFSLLQPKRSVIILFLLVLAASFVTLFYSWLIGAAGILVSITGVRLAGKFGKEMYLKTVGDLANKLSKESYLKARRDNTINKNEIEQKVKELFANDLGLQPILIRRES